MNPEDDAPPEVRSVSDQLSRSQQTGSHVAITLIQHGLQAALGPELDRRALHAALQVRRTPALGSAASGAALTRVCAFRPSSRRSCISCWEQ